MMLTHFDKSIITFINTDTVQHELTIFLSGQAQALPTKSAEGVAHFLLSLITRFGCFSVCISHQGREFVNALNDKHFEIAGIEH